MEKGVQFRLPENHTDSNSASSPDLSHFGARVFTPEQYAAINTTIKEEIPNLRIVKKGQLVRVTGNMGSFDVLLDQDAILRKKTLGRKNRFAYTTRVPVKAVSAQYKNPVTIGSGRFIDPYSKQREISQKTIPDVTQRLRENVNLASLERRFPEVFPRTGN